MKKCNQFISHLAFPIDYSIISINRSTTTWASEAFEKGGDLSREVWHNKGLWYKND